MDYHHTHFFMADTGSHAGHGQSEREQGNKHKLEYLYQIDAAFTLYPLLGSCIRALGKEWRVQAYTTRHLALFTSFRHLLKDPETCIPLELVRGQATIDVEHDPCQLVIIDDAEDPADIKALREQVLGRAHVMVAGNDPLTDDYDLISRFSSQELHPQGVIAFTGQGKGKSTSAFGLAAEAASGGGRAAIVQWFKEPKGPRGTWSINEHYFSDALKDPALLSFYPTGAGFYASERLDRLKGADAYAQHRAHALRGVELAKQCIASGDYAVVVLDELVDTLAEVAQNIPQSLLTTETVRALLSFTLNYPQTRVVVTGRRVTPLWEEFIQRSFVVEEVRHPWSNKGKAAVSGLDF